MTDNPTGAVDSNLVSIVLPTYNEVENIGRLIDQIAESCKDYPIEFVVVDDNSPDGTARLVEEKAKQNNQINLICRRDKRGLTSAIQDGIDASKGSVVVWMDTDLSMPPKIIPLLLTKIEEGFDAAVGSRFVKGGGSKGGSMDGGKVSMIGVYRNLKQSNDTFSAMVLSRLMNYFIQFSLNPSFKDYTSGFIAIKKPVLEEIRLRGDYGEYFMDLIYRCLKRGHKVIEIPYLCLPRQYGQSKTGSNLFDYSRRGIKYILTALRLRFITKEY